MSPDHDHAAVAVFEQLAVDSSGILRASSFFGMPALLIGRRPVAFVDNGAFVIRRNLTLADDDADTSDPARVAWVDPRGRAARDWDVVAVAAGRLEVLVQGVADEQLRRYAVQPGRTPRL